MRQQVYTHTHAASGRCRTKYSLQAVWMLVEKYEGEAQFTYTHVISAPPIDAWFGFPGQSYNLMLSSRAAM